MWGRLVNLLDEIELQSAAFRMWLREGLCQRFSCRDICDSKSAHGWSRHPHNPGMQSSNLTSSFSCLAPAPNDTSSLGQELVRAKVDDLLQRDVLDFGAAVASHGKRWAFARASKKSEHLVHLLGNLPLRLAWARVKDGGAKVKESIKQPM